MNWIIIITFLEFPISETTELSDLGACRPIYMYNTICCYIIKKNYYLFCKQLFAAVLSPEFVILSQFERDITKKSKRVYGKNEVQKRKRERECLCFIKLEHSVSKHLKGQSKGCWQISTKFTSTRALSYVRKLRMHLKKRMKFSFILLLFYFNFSKFKLLFFFNFSLFLIFFSYLNFLMLFLL